MKRFAITLVVFLAGLLLAAPALATPSLVLGPAHGAAPLELRSAGSGYAGELSLRNAGTRPVMVRGLSMREGSADNPRLPRGMTVAFASGRQRAVLAPGDSRRIDVRWTLHQPIRMRQMWGDVVVESGQPGTPPVVAAVHARLPLAMPWLLGHASTWLLLIPLLGIAALLAAHLTGYRKLRNLRWIGIAVGGVQLALSLGLWLRFDPASSRLDGNSGYQFIERSRLLPSLGVEYAFGIDGISIVLLVAVALLVLVASLMSYPIDRRLESYWLFMLLLDVGLTGVFATLDLMLLVCFLAIALSSAVYLAAGWSGQKHAALAPALYTALAWLLLLGVVLFLSGHVGTSYLLDGTPASRSFSLIDMSHVDFASKGLLIGGYNAVKVLYCALFVACAVVLAAPPLHAWLPGALRRAPAGAAILIAGGVMPVGAYLLLRVGYGVLPHGALWAAKTVAMFGALGVAYAGIAALVQSDLKCFAAYASVAQMSLCLLALGSLTVIGVQGAVMQMFGHALVAALLFGAVGALADRLHETRIDRLAGVARERPELGLLAGVALLGSLGLPGTTGFVAELLALIGSTPMQHAAMLIGALGLLIAAVAHIRVFGQVLLGAFPERFRRSPYLDPHGGRLPPLGQRELAALVPLALLVVVLGLVPGLLLGKVRSSCLDQADRVNPAGPTQVVERAVVVGPRLALQNP